MRLRQALPVAAGLGIARVLVTCDVGNVASQRGIENSGGTFDGLAEGAGLDVPKRRCWIDV